MLVIFAELYGLTYAQQHHNDSPLPLVGCGGRGHPDYLIPTGPYGPGRLRGVVRGGGCSLGREHDLFSISILI